MPVTPRTRRDKLKIFGLLLFAVLAILGAISLLFAGGEHVIIILGLFLFAIQVVIYLAYDGGYERKPDPLKLIRRTIFTIIVIIGIADIVFQPENTPDRRYAAFFLFGVATILLSIFVFFRTRDRDYIWGGIIISIIMFSFMKEEADACVWCNGYNFYANLQMQGLFYFAIWPLMFFYFFFSYQALEELYEWERWHAEYKKKQEVQT